MPFGGYKHSGIGREGIAATLEEFSQEKCYVLRNVFAQPGA
jgi:acyl-CoA reductase-like NAD-dependent aldehyde dehydrogenase